MINDLNKMTRYFRNSVATQSNMGIDFKSDDYFTLTLKAVTEGCIDRQIVYKLFGKGKNNDIGDKVENKEKPSTNVIICAKTIKTFYESGEKTQNEIDELTGVYYIPAIINRQGELLFDEGNNRLPWFPREYLIPMIEPKLAVGDIKTVDEYISNNINTVNKIKSWDEYVCFFKDFYETVTKSKFENNEIRNMDGKEKSFELDGKAYVFLDKTVNATFYIMKLYDHLLEEKHYNELYNNFLSTKNTKIETIRENDSLAMQNHCGQMNGEYPLSPSQRESINHYSAMKNGEILAINGPPGTGKTTLLQSIVADMYVKQALNDGDPPIIVAASTNNQAVTNIIASFGNVKKDGVSNLEKRWLGKVHSFATYFPSKAKEEKAKSENYQYTNQKGDFFVNDIECENNMVDSKAKLIKSCKEYFKCDFEEISDCKRKLQSELQFFNRSKLEILAIAQEASKYLKESKAINKPLEELIVEIAEIETNLSKIRARVCEWKSCYRNIPFYIRLLKFIKVFERKIQVEYNFFINLEENFFLNEYMSLDKILEQYVKLQDQLFYELNEKQEKKRAIEKIINRYFTELDKLQQHDVLFCKEENKYKLDLDYVNELLDKKHRHIGFWLSVHYYECRWVNGEGKLSEKQKGCTFEYVLKQFYRRLSMITPCMVMTFYMLPKQFMAFDESKNHFLYNFIDLLIVDEAGQVSPEIAAGAFSLAKKAIVVGDVNQIEPVWSVSEALDKSLAISNNVIASLDEFEILKSTGLNSSCSSVMKVASKCCKYEKFNEKGLFLSEHRRCYNEIIEYCNMLVYGNKLKAMRGNGKTDVNLAIKSFPQMGFKQINTEKSIKKGNSRENCTEAIQIANWIGNNYNLISKAYETEKKENLIGVITPFKAQVKCIEMQIKNKMPELYKLISVGTVHTFQGAERKIIILSTVYGKEDGCYFIDANNSLLNVAVSRAKDNFFVFGDINCLKNTDSSASGLLKRYILNGELVNSDAVDSSVI